MEKEHSKIIACNPYSGRADRTVSYILAGIFPRLVKKIRLGGGGGGGGAISINWR